MKNGHNKQFKEVIMAIIDYHFHCEYYHDKRGACKDIMQAIKKEKKYGKKV